MNVKSWTTGVTAFKCIACFVWSHYSSTLLFVEVLSLSDSFCLWMVQSSKSDRRSTPSRVWECSSLKSLSQIPQNAVCFPKLLFPQRLVAFDGNLQLIFPSSTEWWEINILDLFWHHLSDELFVCLFLMNLYQFHIGSVEFSLSLFALIVIDERSFLSKCNRKRGVWRAVTEICADATELVFFHYVGCIRLNSDSVEWMNALVVGFHFLIVYLVTFCRTSACSSVTCCLRLVATILNWMKS